jgi:hypothetical protein
MKESEKEDSTDIIKVENVLATDLYQQQTKGEIDIQISTAHAYPRNVTRSINNAIAIVSMDEETAKTCVYALPRGNKQVSGASVHLAKILAQCWGNMRIDTKVISIDQKHVTSQAVAFDLESNLAIRVEVKRSITGRTGRFNDDMITMTGNAANAIALRNAVFSVIPRAVIDKAYKAAKQTITGDISDNTKMIAKRIQVVNALKDAYGVTEKEVLAVIHRQSINHIDADDIVTLIGFGQAIHDGDATVENIFRKPIEKDPASNGVEKGANMNTMLENDLKGKDEKVKK